MIYGLQNLIADHKNGCAHSFHSIREKKILILNISLFSWNVKRRTMDILTDELNLSIEKFKIVKYEK